MNKKNYLRFVAILLFVCLVYSNDTLIDIETPYVYGECWMTANGQDQTVMSYDSIEFSNGLKVRCCFSAFEGAWMTIQYWWWIEFAHSDLILSGYKSNPEFLREKVNIENNGYASYCIESSDTSWNGGMEFPDSLEMLDSIYGQYGQDGITDIKLHGISGNSYNEQSGQYSQYNNYIVGSNTNFYVNIKDESKMMFKLPIYYGLNSYPKKFLVKIFWATDSTGSGNFKLEDIVYKTIIHLKSDQIIKIENSINGFCINAISTDLPVSVDIYAVNGRNIREWTILESTRNLNINIKSGIYIIQAKSCLGRIQKLRRCVVR